MVSDLQSLLDAAARRGYSGRALERLQRVAVAGCSLQQFELLEHLARFRISTLHVLSDVFGKEYEAVKSAVRRLRNRGLVEDAPLGVNGQCYFLSAKGARALGRRQSGAALGAAALAKRYGVLLFCTRHSDREKLTEEEFSSAEGGFPALIAPKIDASSYYLDFQLEAPRVGFVYVHTGAADDEVRRKFRERIIGRRMALRPWRELIEGRRFVVGVVTSSASRGEELGQVLGEDWPHVSLDFETLPELDAVRDFTRGA